jgi:hypothetical protein
MLDFPLFLVESMKCDEFLELLQGQLAVLKEKIENSKAVERGRREAHQNKIV